MNIEKETKTIVEEIVRDVENEYKDYALELEVETPTIIKYYLNGLKKGEFSLKKHELSLVKSNLIMGLTSIGFTDSGGYICVFSKNVHHNYFFGLPIKDINKKLPFQKMSTVFTTFHEIGHNLQINPDTSTLEERFCSIYLSDYEGLKGQINNKFHDSLYKEIDANYYAAIESRLYFKGDTDIEKYYDERIGRYGIELHTYDFDSAFSKYFDNLDKSLSNNEDDDRVVYYGESFFLNDDFSLKKPSEIIKSDNYFITSEEKDLLYRIISSDAYLSRINLSELDKNELLIISNAIDYNNERMKKSVNIINNYYNEGKIDDNWYEYGIFTLFNRIGEKEDLKNEIMGIKNVDDDISMFEDMTTPEPVKKVKFITKAKDKLKRIIDKSLNITINSLALAVTYFVGVTSLAVGVDPLISMISTLGVSVAASKFHEYKNRR